MSPSELLRWASAPDHRRSTILLWCGLALFLVSGGLLASTEGPPLVGVALYLVMMASWTAGACGIVGYMRWFFGQSADETQKFHSRPPKK